MSELKTPLYDVHKACGGKIVPFAGYLLPVQYQSGVIAEHMAVRKAVGIFDVSHMGEIVLKGSNALNNLNRLLTNDFNGMEDGQARYSVMCYESGGAVDDLIVYKYAENIYYIVVNAANKDKDFAWMKQHEAGDAVFTDISDKVGQIAIQGPLSKKIMLELVDETVLPEKYYYANFNAELKGIRCIISQTGYTGEDGYELYMAAEDTEKVWNLIMEAGKDKGLIPCGLGARDTLRMEAAMPLYGHELNDEITPLEAGLGFVVKLGKEDFIGKKALEKKEITRKRIGLKVTGKGIVREHMDLYYGEALIGRTTSGTFAPYCGYGIAMAMVDAEYAVLGSTVEVDVRGRRVECEIVRLPFYRKQSNIR